VFKQPANASLRPGTGDRLLNDFTAHVQEVTIINATWASAFTTPARQTPIQMGLSFLRGRGTLQNFFDEVNATPGSVQFITQELVGGACGGAKPTVNTFSQDGLAQ
jgi:phage-related protein